MKYGNIHFDFLKKIAPRFFLSIIEAFMHYEIYAEFNSKPFKTVLKNICTF